MSFQTKGPEVIHNYNPEIKPPFTREHAIDLSIVLPRTEKDLLYIKAAPLVKFRKDYNFKKKELFYFQVKTEFWITPIYDIEERNKHIYNLICTSILNFNELLPLADYLPKSILSTVVFEEPYFRMAKEAIEKSVRLNQAN